MSVMFFDGQWFRTYFFFKWDENENTFWDFAAFKILRISALMKSDDFFDCIFLLKVETPNPHDSFMTQTLKGIPIATYLLQKMKMNWING